MPGFAPGAVSLGTVSIGSANATVGPINFAAGYGMLFGYFYVAGYSASTIALLRIGATSGTPDSGTNYSVASNNFNTSTTLVAGQLSASQNGVRVANDAVTNARRGTFRIHNPAGTNSTFDIHTVTYSAQAPTAASALTSQSIVAGTWFNTAQAVTISLNVTTGTLNAGSYLSLYGIPGTP
jgi:hypothetical protein